jgi:hypothetical protein
MEKYPTFVSHLIGWLFALEVIFAGLNAVFVAISGSGLSLFSWAFCMVGVLAMIYSNCVYATKLRLITLSTFAQVIGLVMAVTAGTLLSQWSGNGDSNYLVGGLLLFSTGAASMAASLKFKFKLDRYDYSY